MTARRKSSRAFKLEAVKLAQERGVSVRQADQSLNVHEHVLRKGTLVRTWLDVLDTSSAFYSSAPTLDTIGLTAELMEACV